MDAQAIVDPQIVADMIQKRAWLPLGALAVGLSVRLLKSDVRFFPTLSWRYRVWACFALGQLAGTIESVIAGKTYKEAIYWGLAQSIMAIVGQNTVIDSLRGGKEIPIPGLTKNTPKDLPPPSDLSKVSAEIRLTAEEEQAMGVVTNTTNSDKIPTESGKRLAPP